MTLHRRDLLKLLGAAVGVGGVASASASPPPADGVGVDRLRPPGAVPEDEFLRRCIRCGRCAGACPYRAIVPGDLNAGAEAGAPLVDVRTEPCQLCMLCVDVCPTGALRPVGMEETRMGLAVIDHATCVAWTGETLCRTCYSVCPLRDSAIHLPEFRPVVDDACTGCGICVHACPVTLPDGGKPVAVDPDPALRGGRT